MLAPRLAPTAQSHGVGVGCRNQEMSGEIASIPTEARTTKRMERRADGRGQAETGCGSSCRESRARERLLQPARLEWVVTSRHAVARRLRLRPNSTMANRSMRHHRRDGEDLHAMRTAEQ